MVSREVITEFLDVCASSKPAKCPTCGEHISSAPITLYFDEEEWSVELPYGPVCKSATDLNEKSVSDVERRFYKRPLVRLRRSIVRAGLPC
jgi:hypothetical protein